MKVTLEFNLPEEKEDHINAINGSKYKDRIDTLYDEVFRPIFKYGKQVTPHVAEEDELSVATEIWVRVSEHFNLDD